MDHGRRLVLNVFSLVLALALSLPLTMGLALLVTGFGDPGKQVYLPVLLLVPELLLSLILPIASAVVFGWWGLWRRRLAHVKIGVLVGCAWVLLFSLYVLDFNWGRVGFAPAGQVFLINAANEPLIYATTPPVSDDRLTLGMGRTIQPGGIVVLRNVPANGMLQISASNAAGLGIFCDVYTPDRLARSNRRVEMRDGTASCN